MSTLSAAQRSRGSVFNVTYPPKMINANWRVPRAGAYNEVAQLSVDFAKHLAEGPCPCFLLAMQSAHSGGARNWICWLYNDFGELEAEDAFWHKRAPAEFMREHRGFNKRFADAFGGEGRDTWVVLREDLSYRPRMSAAKFGKLRFVQMDELRVRPGRADDFAENRRTLAKAYAAARVEEPFWVYEMYSGGPTGSYQIWTPYTTLTRLDRVPDIRSRVDRALGDNGRKVANETAEASILESETGLFAINPGGSYIAPQVAASDRKFWNSLTPPWP